MDGARIVLQPLGEVAAAVLDRAAEALRETYRAGRVEVAVPQALTRVAYDVARRQYRAGRLLDALAAMRSPGTYLVGIMPSDIYEPGTNFLFGLGSSERRTALVATARFGTDDRAAGRAAKAVVHEMGHAVGLGHCDVEGCVMLYSNDLASFDRKSARFCQRHRAMADELLASAAPC